MTDIFAVQDDVAAAIIDALEIHVAANPTRGRPTESMEAYALFLQARALLSRRQNNVAEELLLKAVELDLNFAEAHEMLASVYWRESDQRRTFDSAAKALAIDPDLVYAQAMYQSASIGTRLANVEAFERGVREQPGNPSILGNLSWSLLQAGYLGEAVRLAERMVEIEPLSSEAYYDLGKMLYAVGRTIEAVAAMDFAGQLHPDDRVYWEPGVFHLVEKRDETAIAYYEDYLKNRGYADTTWASDLITNARDPETGQAYLDRRIPEIIASAGDLGDRLQWKLPQWYSVFGFPERHLDIILDLNPTDSAWENFPELWLFDGIFIGRLGFTGQPKFLKLAETMGLIKIWEKRGPPDFCDKVDGEWVCE